MLFLARVDSNEATILGALTVKSTDRWPQRQERTL